MELTQEALAFIKERYQKKFGSLDDFEENLELYQAIPDFGANENYYEASTHYQSSREALKDSEGQYVNPKEIDTPDLKPEVHWIMRTAAHYYVREAFKAMKIRLDDDNIAEKSLNKGTPGRIVKTWVGSNPMDTTELGSGRWNREPYLSVFPNTDNDHSIITKEVEVISNCSHHFIPFSTLDGGKAIIEYIPDKYVLGISKLQRFVNWAARRFWLQEDLTSYIGKTIQRIAGTEDVHVKLEGVVHGCEKFRGVNARGTSLTTEFKGGYFKAVR